MKFKRFLSLILCLTLMFQFYIFKYHEVTAEASDFAMPSDAYLKSVIAPLLVSAGLVFRSQQALDDTVQKVQLRIIQGGLDSTVPRPPNDPKPPRTWKEVLTALATGYVVYDVATGLYKNVVSIGSDFFHFIKTFVDENFNVGDNVISKYTGNFITYEPYKELTNIYFPGSGYNFYVEWKYLGSSNVFNSSCYLPSYSEHTRGYIGCFPPGIDKLPNTPGNGYDGNNSGMIYFYSGYGGLAVNIWRGSIDRTLEYVRYGIGRSKEEAFIGSISVINVSGSSGIVDNPNYDWNNNFTGDKTLVLPVETSPLGLPSFTPDGLPVPDLAPDYMVNVNPDVIPEQNPTGIKYNPDGSELPEPVSPTYPDDLPHVDIDNPNKRSLLLSKFPFCLPWDLKNLFSLFLAPAEAPRFEIDFIPPAFKSKVGIEGSTQFVLDMSDFPLVGKMSRFFSFLSACLGLILVSRRIMNS